MDRLGDKSHSLSFSFSLSLSCPGQTKWLKIGVRSLANDNGNGSSGNGNKLPQASIQHSAGPVIFQAFPDLSELFVLRVNCFHELTSLSPYLSDCIIPHYLLFKLHQMTERFLMLKKCDRSQYSKFILNRLNLLFIERLGAIGKPLKWLTCCLPT